MPLCFRRAALLVAGASGLALCVSPASAQPSTDGQVRVVTSPEPLPATHDKARLFLGGSIDMGSAPNWQRDVIDALKNEDILVLNPRRADWDPAWKPEASDPNFKQQVEWELAALESSDVIIIYFAPGSQSPVSLLEMGLHARTGKLVVLCPDGYWRKGNVDITASKYGVTQVHSINELIEEIRRRLKSRS